MRADSYDIWCRNLDNHQTSTEHTCGRIYQNRQTYAQHHIQWQKDQHLHQGEYKSRWHNQQCENIKWSWSGHMNRFKYDRWTSRVTTWRPHDKKGRQGRRPGQILKGHDMTEDSAWQANSDSACWGIFSTTGHYGCSMMVMYYDEWWLTLWLRVCNIWMILTDRLMADVQ